MTPVPELNDLVETVVDRSPSGTELDRLRAASEVAREVGRVGEDLVTHYVDEARAAGASWSDIGDVLGVTRQGAHQRHHDRPRPDKWWRFEGSRFTDRARSAVRSAIDEAREADNAFVGTEHILLGILDVPGNLAVTVVEHLGVTTQALRDEVTGRLLPPETEPRPAPVEVGEAAAAATAVAATARPGAGGIPFTPQARRVFDLAAGESLSLGHNYMGCEHLLLAVALSDGIAAEALKAVGLDIDRLRQGVAEVTDSIEATRRASGEIED